MDINPALKKVEPVDREKLEVPPSPAPLKENLEEVYALRELWSEIYQASEHEESLDYWDLQHLAMLEIWREGKTEPHEFIELTEDMYFEKVVDKSGKVIADRPWVIIFYRPYHSASNQLKESLDKLAMYFNGGIQFAHVNEHHYPWLHNSYQVYETPRAWYIDPTTNAAYFFEGWHYE